MNPVVIELIATALVKYGPTVARELYELFRAENPTPEQWKRLFDTASKSYDDYVRKIPAGS